MEVPELLKLTDVPSPCVVAGASRTLALLCKSHVLKLWGAPTEDGDLGAVGGPSIFGGLRVWCVDPADGQESAVKKAMLKQADTDRILAVAQEWATVENDLWPGVLVDCGTPPPWKAGDWAVRWASEAGVKLTGPAVKLLRTIDFERLRGEVGKLAAYAGGREADEADVTLVCGVGGDRTWELLDCLDRGKEAKCREILDRLFSEGRSEREAGLDIYHKIGPALKGMVRAAGIRRSRKILATDALREAGIDERAAGRAASGIVFLRERLNHVLDWLLETERGLKSGTPPREAIGRLFDRLLHGETTGVARRR